MEITTLGECRFPSPEKHFVSDQLRLPAVIRRSVDSQPEPESLTFELAGRREKLFFDPAKTRAGIVTCGGLCPGLNNVIRSAFLELTYGYGVQEVIGFRNGYAGLDPNRGQEPLLLSADLVEDIHKEGGTMLGTSRGPVDTRIAVDNLIRRGVNLLLCVGGDGTQRGAHDLYVEARKRGHPLAVTGVPKTIDNDVLYVTRTFGYMTALEESRWVIDAAHTEAHSVENGISLVKLMGRHAGFIAAGATIASQDVNFCLIPEVPFALEGPGGFLVALKERVLRRRHAVIVVAEGAGQELIPGDTGKTDSSGNIVLQEIGGFLRERIEAYFKAEGVPVVFRYLDPSYQIRSRMANCGDAILCDQFARHAVHAGMAGKTGLVIGYLHNQFIHVP
ncbi:MAG: ATP-dependent 6-phosphofructokinase, partial [Verrucomicrobia bacterium]|nr:ATP-dependent 6-phosphofructokinase [Verrucomicrobiota bacterium]